MTDLSTAIAACLKASNEDFDRWYQSVDLKEATVASQKFRYVASLLSRKPPPPPEPDVNLVALSELLSRPITEAVGESSCEADYRLVDIWVVEGGQQSEESKLRRILAQRSCALQYKRFNPRKLEEMCKKENLTPDKSRGGSIRDWVRRTFPGTDHESCARNAVAAGLRLLAIEAKYEQPGTSCVMMFAKASFSDCAFAGIKTLFKCPELQKRAAAATHWLEEAQQYYDSKPTRRPGYESSMTKASPKRPRNGSMGPPQKRRGSHSAQGLRAKTSGIVSANGSTQDLISTSQATTCVDPINCSTRHPLVADVGLRNMERDAANVLQSFHHGTMYIDRVGVGSAPCTPRDHSIASPTHPVQMTYSATPNQPVGCESMTSNFSAQGVYAFSVGPLLGDWNMNWNACDIPTVPTA